MGCSLELAGGGGRGPAGLPEGIDVKVVENSDNTVHITLPMAPDGHEELSMGELSQAAGGDQLRDDYILSQIINPT